MKLKLLALAALSASVSVFTYASSSAQAEPAPCGPATIGADSFCPVGGVRLHYVDWGGTGPAIILISGLGDSARIFDDLAPRSGFLF